MYELLTSIETKLAFSGTLVFSMKLMKSVVSFRYDSCFSATGCSSLSINRDSLSVGPSQPRTTNYGWKRVFLWLKHWAEYPTSGAKLRS